MAAQHCPPNYCTLLQLLYQIILVRQELTRKVTGEHFRRELILIAPSTPQPQQRGEGVGPHKKSLILAPEVGLS
jgi:hypothetical protein